MNNTPHSTPHSQRVAKLFELANAKAFGEETEAELETLESFIPDFAYLVAQSLDKYEQLFTNQGATAIILMLKEGSQTLIAKPVRVAGLLNPYIAEGTMSDGRDFSFMVFQGKQIIEIHD